MVSFCIELFCVVTLQYQMLVRIAIAYFIIEKKKAAPQPWQAIAQRFCSIRIWIMRYTSDETPLHLPDLQLHTALWYQSGNVPKSFVPAL